jgi:dTDP-4-dehydrorhamnose 3,5-epimerase
VAPHEEANLVHCTRGMLYVPEGCAHGFLTLEDDTECSTRCQRSMPEPARGVRFDDPAFGIRWPAEVTVLSERYRGYPEWAPV